MRIAYGTRVSLLVGVLASALAVLVGTVVGIAAGWYGGLVDRALSRLMDVVLSLPFLVFALALVAVVGPSLTISVTVIAFFTWASVGRIVRAQALSIRELEYVQAARTLGASHARVMFVEILPNVTASVIVYTTLLIPGAITGEATLSFLGLSVVPPTPSWGNMLADAMAYYKVAWWFVCLSGRGAALTTVAFNVLGDSVRDALDPRRDSASRGTQQRGWMIRFLLRRVAWSALVVWVVATSVFVIYFAVPRDVARLIAGRQASEQTIQIVRTRLGLDRPVPRPVPLVPPTIGRRRPRRIVPHAGAGDRDRRRATFRSPPRSPSAARCCGW